MKVWTDYPFDGPHELVEVELLAFDTDKYCVVRLPDGRLESVKIGYLHRTEALDDPLYSDPLPGVPKSFSHYCALLDREEKVRAAIMLLNDGIHLRRRFGGDEVWQYGGWFFSSCAPDFDGARHDTARAAAELFIPPVGGDA